MRDSKPQGKKQRQTKHMQKRLLPRKFRLLVTIMLLLATCTFDTLHASEPALQSKSLLDQIWPYSLSSQKPLSKQDQKYAEAAFIQWLEAYLRGEYEVSDQHFFWGKGKSAVWVAIGKGHALYPENENGRWRVLEEIEQGWRSPGFDLVRMWKVSMDGKEHYVAIAMTNEPVPGTRGQHLIGRFELRKVIE